MTCPDCAFDNPEGVKFCGRCGAALIVRCRHCAAESPSHLAFCGRCGNALRHDGSHAGVSSSSASEAERRQLTVLFCDLVGSTELSQLLSLEELREELRLYQSTCGDVVGQFDGYIAQYLGDGVLVYFGYPRAHEDDAQRAVHAALAILEALERLNRAPQRARRPRLAARIGIHTGPVVVGEIGEGQTREHLALGQTPNVAAGFQALADPGTVVISAATHRLVRSFFVFRAIGARRLEGVSRAMEAYQVLGLGTAHSAVEFAGAGGLTPLVGRESELEQLARCWRQARQGSGRVALVTGEAGIGKTRIVYALAERLAEESHLRLECFCSP